MQENVNETFVATEMCEKKIKLWSCWNFSSCTFGFLPFGVEKSSLEAALFGVICRGVCWLDEGVDGFAFRKVEWLDEGVDGSFFGCTQSILGSKTSEARKLSDQLNNQVLNKV